MTIITAPDIFNLVDAPVGVPYRYGLDSVVEYNQSDVHDLNGLTWVSENCPVVGETTNPCFDPAFDPLNFGLDQCAVPEFKPFTIYLPMDGSLGSSDDSERARRMFTLGEQYGVESVFSAWLAATVAETAITVGTTVEKLSIALAYVEQTVLAGSKVEPVIHMSRFAASLLSGALIASGNQLRTTLGTKVAAYGGWLAGPPATDVIYGTGPIKGVRGQIDLINAPDRATNSNNIVASRTYVLGYDCNAVGASVTL